MMKRKLKTSLTALLLIFSFLNAGCLKETIQGLSDALALRRELLNYYRAPDIAVVIQKDNILGISFINSEFNGLAESDKAAKAEEIALFAKNHFASIRSIERIWVAFLVYHSWIVFHYRNSVGTYFFEKNKIGTMTPVQTNAVISQYNSGFAQTDVYLARNVQLSKSGSGGVMLFAHFTVPGREIIPPLRVTLDFSTYSTKRMFADDPDLAIFADGKKVFDGKALVTKTLGDDSEASVNQFLTANVSYAQFVEVATATEARIVLGPKEFTLAEPDLRTLRDMIRCVDQSGCP